MDSFKTLIERGEFELVIDLTKGELDADGAYYRLLALISLNKAKEAMALAFAKRDLIFSKYPTQLFKINFELRLSLHQFDAAYEDVEYFHNAPYVSQALEEAIAQMPKKIREEEKLASKAKGGMDEEEIEAALKGESEGQALLAIENIKKGRISDYEDLLVEFCQSSHHESMRTYALFLLIAAKSIKQFNFAKGEKSFLVLPASLSDPFSNSLFRKVVSAIQSKCKDPSVSDVAIQLFSQYIIDKFPEPFLEISLVGAYAASFTMLGYEYLNASYSLDSLASSYGIDAQTLGNLHDSIKAEMLKAPVLKI